MSKLKKFVNSTDRNVKKPTVSYLLQTFLRPLNDQHAQKFAEKPVIHIYDI